MFAINANRVRTLMFEKNICGVYALARQAKLNAATTAKVVKGGARVTAKTIAALAKLFGVNGNDLILKE